MDSWLDDKDNCESLTYYDVRGNIVESADSRNCFFNNDEIFKNLRKSEKNMNSNWRNTREKEFFLEMDFPQSFVGKLIGKGGANIKQLQHDMCVRIKIKKDSVDNYGNILIKIFGYDQENVDSAKENIQNLIEDTRNYGNRNSSYNNLNRNYNQRDFDKNSFSRSHNCNNFDKKSEEPTFQKDSKVRVDWKKAKRDFEKFQEDQLASYAPIKKDFYEEDLEVSALTPNEVAAVRLESQNIVVESLAGLKAYSWFREEDSDRDERKRLAEQDKVQKPVLTFSHAFKKYPAIMAEISRNGFVKPSPIQMQAWPVIMSGRDFIGIAQTGTGKTLAFLLPAFIHIMGQPIPREQRPGPTVLILTPTRELALQIEEEVKKYKYEGIKCVCVYGGGSRRDQIDLVQRGTEIVVATPGRLTDLKDNKFITLESVSYLVLDEADRMLDLGFEPAIRNILSDIRIDRQTIMTSATWPSGVRKLACSFQKNPIQVFVGTLDLAAVHSVEQRIVMVDDENKFFELKNFFHSELTSESKVLVFMGRKATVDHVHSELTLQDEFHVQSIHGGHEQADRERALEDLKSGYVRILLATDVASRGIDVKDLTHVLNYDLPKNMEEYVHRVGRTGRAGKKGIAVSFVSRSDWATAQKLIDILNEASQFVPPELLEMAQRFQSMKVRKFQDRRDFNARSYNDDFM